MPHITDFHVGHEFVPIRFQLQPREVDLYLQAVGESHALFQHQRYVPPTALAAYALLNANINQIANRIDRKIETVEPKPEPVSPARRIRRVKQQNWVNGWR